MKGVGHNIARDAVRRHKEFKSEIYSYCGHVDIIEARKDCLRFVCSTERQRDILLEIETVVSKNVNVTKPYPVLKLQDQPVMQPKRWSKGVISGVLADTTDDEVKEETSAVMARRITRMVDGEIIPTRSVIIAFEDELPREVSSIFDATESNYMCRNPSCATSAKPLDTRSMRQRQRFAPAARRRNMTTAVIQSPRSMRSAELR